MVVVVVVGGAVGGVDVVVVVAMAGAPGTVVTATVTMLVPAGYLPGLGTYASVHDTATYSGAIDQYAADGTTLLEHVGGTVKGTRMTAD